MKGDIPLTVTIRPDLRIRLKAEANRRRISQGRLIEILLEKMFRTTKEVS